MTQIAQGAHAYIFPEPGQVYRVQADDVATVQIIYGAPSALITLTAQSQTFGPYDSPAKLKVSANTAACEYTLIRAHYAELTQQQLAGGAVGVLASNNAGGAIEPDGDVPSLGGGGSSVTVINDLTTGGTTAALSAEMGKTLQTNKLGANADAIADVLEAAATGAPADLARIQSSVSGGWAPRWSICATGCGAPWNDTFGTPKQFMSRVTRTATEDLTIIRATYVNWSAKGDLEYSSGSAAQVHSGIEFPIGNFIGEFLFSASTIGNIPSGGELPSDPLVLPVKILKGQRFAERVWFNGPAGGPYYGDGINSLGSTIDGCSFGATVADTVVGTSAVANTSGGIVYRAAAIEQVTRASVIGMDGDSRLVGINDQASDMWGGVGQMRRMITPQIACFSVASPGATLNGASGAGHAKRRAMLTRYCNYVFSNYGTNDLASGAAYTLLVGYMATYKASISNLPLYQATIPPLLNTSTDGWTTVSGQTVHSNNTGRINFNFVVRGGQMPGVDGCIEIARYVESSVSGKWQADGVTPGLFTTDGNHETQYANQVIAQANPLRTLLGLLTRNY